MRVFQLSMVSVLAVAVSACGGSDASTTPGYAEDLGRHVDALQSEQSAHSSEVIAATTVDSINRVEGDHWQRMADHMSQMDMVMGHMSSCNEGQGGHCANALFAGMMHDVRTESDDHRAALQGAATLDAARTEESRHQAAMRDRLAGMRGQISAMPGQESTQHCSGM